MYILGMNFSNTNYHVNKNNIFVQEPSRQASLCCLSNVCNNVINFKSSNTSAGNVLKKLKNITCPYFGVKMISGVEINKLERLLDNCKTLSDALKIIEQYKPSLQRVEKKIFYKLKNFSKLNPNGTAEDCLKELYSEALIKLKLEEFKVLDNVDKISQKLSPATALNVRAKTVECRQIILENNEDNFFKRKTFLASLDEIVPLEKEKDIIKKMKDKAWYLPTSNTSENAFIIKYATRKQIEILKRLLRASIATIEHIKPNSLGGENDLSNFMLVSSSANSSRSNIPLIKFIERYRKIPQFCQKYIEEIIDNIKIGRLRYCEGYPANVKKVLYLESNEKINLDISEYNKYMCSKKKKCKKKYY